MDKFFAKQSNLYREMTVGIVFVLIFSIHGLGSILKSDAGIQPDILISSSDSHTFITASSSAVQPTDVGITEIVVPATWYCDSILEAEVVLTNFGPNLLESVFIIYEINNQTDTFFWTGSLEAFGSVNVLLPNANVEPGLNDFTVYTHLPNGEDDPNPGNDSSTTQFSSDLVEILIEIVLDDWPNETTWELTDLSGNVLFSGGPYPGMDFDTVSYTFCIQREDCFEFTIFDSFGDGICCFWGDGSYTVTNVSSGAVMATGGEFRNDESHVFCTFDDDAGVFAILDPTEIQCDSLVEPQVVIFNYGMNAISSVYVFYQLNEDQPDSIFWSGNLEPYEMDTVDIPQLIASNGTNLIQAYTSMPNGGPDPNSINDTLEVEFYVGPIPVSLTIVLDFFPRETTWDIVDASGNLLYSGGPYIGFSSGDTVSYFFCLADSCYTFTIYDSWGDGICCGWGEGSYSLVNELTGEILASGGNFNFEESTGFCLGNPLLVDIADVNHIPCGESETGGASVIVSGGTGNYSFLWSNGSTDSVVSNLEGGIHFLTVTDGFSTVDDTVFIEGGVPPTAVCQNVIIYLDGSGEVSLLPSDVDGGSVDSCGIDQLLLSQTHFDCSDSGINSVQLTVVNTAEQEDQCTALVTVSDSISPLAVCRDTLVFLDENGAAMPLPESLDGGSSDNCNGLSFSILPESFGCGDIGFQSVVLTVSDAGGNSSSCTSNLEILDNQKPEAICQDIVIGLNTEGLAFIEATDVDGGSFDNCGIQSVEVNISDFDCGDTGTNFVVLTVTDMSGNTASCNAEVEVSDELHPELECPDDVIVSVEQPGDTTAYVVTAEAMAADNCGIATLENNYNNGGANASGDYPVGLTSIVFTATDLSGNSTQCTLMVEVEADETITAVCQDVEVFLDEAGFFELNAASLDGGSSGGSGTLSYTVGGLEWIEFNCVDLGSTTLELEVSDGAGQVALCNSNVSIVDNLPPVALCLDIILSLDQNGEAVLSVADVDAGSNDNCDVAEIELSETDFGCDEIGLQSVILMVSDSSGNSSQCTAQITVEDPFDPVFDCDQSPLVLEVNSNCMAEVGNLENRVSVEDNCLDYSDFTFHQNPPAGTSLQSGEEIILIITVSEPGGWTANCEISVSALNTSDLIWLSSSPEDELLECGDFSPEIPLLAADFCDTLVVFPTADTIWGCPGIQSIVRVWMVGSLQYSQVVSFTDDEPPFWTSSLPSNTAVPCDNIPDPAVLTAGDDCSSATINFTESEIPGSNPGEFLLVRVWTASDECGNSISHQQFLTVSDPTPPQLDCPSQIYYDLQGQCDVIMPLLTDSVEVWDNCTDTSNIQLTQSPLAGSVLESLTTTVFVTAVDQSGNSNFCVFTLNFENQGGSSSLVCDEVNFEFPADSGECGAEIELEISWIQGCDDPTVENSFNQGGHNAGGFYQVGETSVVFQLLENGTLLDECEIIVVIQDFQSPVVSCISPVFGQLEIVGDTVVWVEVPEVTATDNCAIESIENSYNANGSNASDFYPHGLTEVVFTVQDSFNNSSSCTTTVVVLDSLESPDTFLISGNLLTPLAFPVAGAKIEITGDTTAVVFSDSTGDYSFLIPEYYSFSVAPALNENWLDGVSTLDLILIQRAILNIDSLVNPYFIIGADANRDGLVSTIDLVLIQRLILGLDTTIANNTSWRFVPADYQFENSANPLQEDWPESKSYDIIGEDKAGENWVAIKTGDVSGDAAASGSREIPGTQVLVAEVNESADGSSIVQIRSDSDISLSGIQMEFSIGDLTNFEIVHDLSNSALRGISGKDFYFDRENSVYRVVWYHPTGISLGKGDILFGFKLGDGTSSTEAQSFIRLSSRGKLWESKIYRSSDFSLVRPQLKWSIEKTQTVFELYQNQPNPFSGHTSIPFRLPRDMSVTLEVFDLNGKLVRIETVEGYSGINYIQLNLSHLPRGSYVYRLSGEGISASRKMILSSE